MRIISIANHKGGVGKTTTTASIGKALSLEGYKTLLIDLDAQCNLTDLFPNKEERTIYEALTDLKGLPITRVSENLDICKASINLVAIDIELAETDRREYRLSKLLQSVKYDYVLIDCPPSLGLLTINALTASTDIFIPLTGEALPMKGLSALQEIIQIVKETHNSRLSLSGIILTRYNRRKINKLVEESLREVFGDLVLKTKIRDNVDISESPLLEKDIFSYSPDSIGAKDYRDLTREILERFNN